MSTCTAVSARRQPIACAVALSSALHALAIVAIEAGPPLSVRAAGNVPEAFMVADVRPDALPASNEPRLAGQAASAALDAEAQAHQPVSRRAETEAPASPPPSAATRHPQAAAAPAARRGHEATRQSATAAAAPLARDPTYHAIAALDRPPMPLAPPDDCYPSGARGELAYELWIDETGVIDRALVVSLAIEGAADAVERCRQLAFAPAMKDGRPVRSKVRFVVGPRIDTAAK